MGLEKPRRVTDEAFLDFVRGKVCAVTGAASPDAHHLRTRASGGSDYTAVPLSRVMHIEWHKTGDRKFSERHGINLWRVNSQLLAEYFSDSAVILKKASEIIADTSELTPLMQDRLRRLALALKHRRDRAEVVNA